MKFNIKSFLAAVVVLAPVTGAVAQNTYSAYFTEGYTFRHDMNPAFGNEKNYVSMPALGNVNVSMQGNLAVDHILYNVNGKTTTFMNPNVNAQEFLKHVNGTNRLGANVKMEILSGGFKAFGGYNTVSVNLRSTVGTTIPGSLLRLAKEGPANQSYDISDFKAHADAYAELAFGHSRQLTDQLRVGAKVKFLLGGGNVDANFEKAQLTLGEDQFTAVSNAQVQTSIKGFYYKMEEKMRGPENAQTKHTYVNDMDIDGGGLNGFGMALDLGAEYKLDKDWTFSAALLDFGFISWNNNIVASTNGERTFTTDKYIFNIDENADNKFGNEMDRLGEGIATLYELQDNGDQGGRTKMLGATLNLAAQYRFPYYDKLTFGLVNTTRIQGAYSWTDFRLSANVAPVKIFSAGASLAAGSYGVAFGWILNLHMTGFNFYLGMDRTLGSLAKQGLPLSSNGSVNLGINFLF